MILVTGAMGRIGTAAVAALQQRGAAVRALVPSTTRVPWLSGPGVHLLEGDCDAPHGLDEALDGVTAVILIARPAAEQVDAQRRVMDACAAHGIGRIVKLSVAGAGADAEAEAGRCHWRAERHLLDVAASPGIVRVGRTMQDLLYQEPLFLAHHMIVGCQGNGMAADVDARDVGAVLAGLALATDMPDAPVLATGPEAMGRNDMAAQLGQALGLTLRYVSCTPDELAQVLAGAGVNQWQVDDLVADEEMAAAGQFQTVTDAVERWTGRPARAFAAFANELATSLRYAHKLPASRGTLLNALPPEVVLEDG